MNNKGNQFQELTFYQLLNTKKVEIPIIQRDYAQGRETQEKIRNNFLDIIFNALNNGNSIQLDFIYGSEKDNVLQPLDGQQRLTTLFLLHLYIACKENKLNEKVKNILCNFSYETRTSSREFCNELVKNGIDFENLINNEISKTIKNKSWFIMSWEKDPTISAMLIMLDSIHKKFNQELNFWEKLVDETNLAITFLYVKLENFGLSDDLYIKMNARGKALTVYENFKAQFEKHIDSKQFESEQNDCNINFSHNIDNAWTELFWTYKDGNNIDDKLINFIAGIAINYYAEKLDIEENKEEIEKIKEELLKKGLLNTVSDEVAKKERIERRIQTLANNSKEVFAADFFEPDAFSYLVNCFNIYAKKQDDEYVYAKLNLNINLFKVSSEHSSLFKEFIECTVPNYKLRVLFYAQTVYLLENSSFSEEFYDWLRVIRNIVQNSTIDSANTFVAAIGLVKELSEGCSNIYKYLNDKTSIKSRHAGTQVKEEIQKSKLIVSDHNNKDIIHKTEDTNFCKGKINFALYCADYDIDSETAPNPKDFNSENLKKMQNVLVDHLNGNDVKNDFRRAFFTVKEDYYDYWDSWLHAVGLPKRRLIEDMADLKKHFTNRNDYSNALKELIKKLSEINIDKMIDDFMKTQNFNNLPHWKKIIIREKELLNTSTKHYIAIDNDNGICYLIPATRVSNDNNGRVRLTKIDETTFPL